MKKRSILNIIITLVIAIVAYYFLLPPLNLTSPAFWVYVLALVFLFAVLNLGSSLDFTRKHNKMQKSSEYLLIGIGGIVALILGIDLIMSPLFQSSSYAKRIVIQEDGNFTEDVAPVDFSKLPLLDKDSSQKLGDRVMGQMPELVSQFTVSPLYTQINYNDQIIRVTPLEYNGIFKYFANRNEGVKGYITVNSVSGESDLVKLEKGMRYMPSAMFFENLSRHVRLQYPTEIFDRETFEIDNEGNPYWIIPTIEYKGIGLRREINGIIMVDPVTGNSKKYKIDEVPTWVDHVYHADLIIEQTDNWGSYKNGFFNSLFGQKGVVQTTDGYNYLIMNDDVYLYTGITSAANDRSNLGFILTNMRTKETIFYSVPGAEEYSAMESAKGQVQQMKYTSTFPLLINLNGKATYMVSLKDNAGLVKMYAFIDVADYQQVVVTDAAKGIEEAAQNYLSGRKDEVDPDQILEKAIQIDRITSAILDGNTYYYLVDTAGLRYRASLKGNEDRLPFLRSGDTITIRYLKEKDLTEIVTVK